MASANLFRAFFTVLGVVAVLSGLYGAATGVEGMLGDDSAGANVDSELRFFSVFWAAYGAVALWVAPRVATEPTLVRWLALALFVAGLARVVSWIDVGRPDAFYLVLMAIELTAPPLVVLGQARLARALR